MAKQIYYYYCPTCVKMYNDASIKRCTFCSEKSPIQESKYTIESYRAKSMEQYGDVFHGVGIFKCEELGINNPYMQSPTTPEQRLKEKMLIQTTSQPSNTPKCPTCSSVNIRKIGTLERGASFSLFGFASGKIGKSMVCKDCGYKW